MDFILHFLQYNPGKGFLFTGIGFWIFMAIVLAGFCLLHRKRQARNTFLFACNLFFFYKMAGAFLLILLLSILLNYGIGLQTSAAPDCSKKRWMTAGIIANLLILAVFKYNAFFIQSFNALFDTGFTAIDYFSADYLSSAFAGPAWFESLFPPVGLSFFTLQAISYLVDIKRGSAKAISNIADFGLYYCFFPKAIAGPIVRTGEFAPQLRQYYMLSRKEFSIALGLIITGLIKKIIFADYLALHSSPAIFMQPEMYSGMEKWIALYAFSLRIYMDFSGYADIAIGIAALLGFQLPGNFRAPYQACTLTDFWRRWHISLSSWLRDYAYIPLGGNRHGKWKMCIALTAVFLMAALWHEAGMGFLLWGLVHGVLVCIEKCTAWPERVEKKRFGKIAGWFLMVPDFQRTQPFVDPVPYQPSATSRRLLFRIVRPRARNTLARDTEPVQHMLRPDGHSVHRHFPEGEAKECLDAHLLPKPAGCAVPDYRSNSRSSHPRPRLSTRPALHLRASAVQRNIDTLPDCIFLKVRPWAWVSNSAI